MPKVSICIPCYQYPEDMRVLLDSIQKQSYSDYEVIITDDTRDDSVETVVFEYQCGSLEGKIQYYKNENQLGHIFNWNAALDKACGEYIKIMFSDDWFTDENSLEKMVELLENTPEASLCFTGTRQVMRKKEGNEIRIVSTRDRYASPEFLEKFKEDYRNLFLGNEVGAPSATLYRACAARFDERSNWASDMFLYFEILKENPRFVYSTEPLISIGESDEQYTYMFDEYDDRKYQDYQYMYQKYHLQESEQCKDYFLNKLIIPYREMPMEAVRNHIPIRKYVKAVKTQEKRYFLEMLGNLCFWLALTIEMAAVMMDKSAYVIQNGFYLFLITGVLFGAKIVTSQFARREWIVLFALGFISLISYYYSGRTDMFRALIMMGAVSRVRIKDVFRYTFAITALGSIVIIVLSFLGIGYPLYETKMYHGGGLEETRYSFGMGHPNAFMCMMLMLYVLWMYLYFERSKWYQYVIIEMANIFIFMFTRSKFGFAMFTVSIMLVLFVKYIPKMSRQKWIYWVSMVIYAMSLIMSFMMAKTGVGLAPIFRTVDDKLLNGRLQTTYWWGPIDTWSLFSSRENIEFFDMGWARLFYWYGWIPASICVIIVFWMLWQCMKKKQIEALLMIFILNLYNVFEAHLISNYIGRNYLILLAGVYFLTSIGKKQEKRFLWKMLKK